MSVSLLLSVSLPRSPALILHSLPPSSEDLKQICTDLPTTPWVVRAHTVVDRTQRSSSCHHTASLMAHHFVRHTTIRILIL